MRRPPARATVPALLLAVLVTLLTAGCGGSSTGTSSSSSAAGSPSAGPSGKAAVCTDLDDVKRTVQSLKDLQVQRGTLTTLQSDVTALRGQLAQLKSDAKDQYAGELSQLSLSLTALSTTVKAATADPTKQTLAAVVPALRAVRVSADALVSSVSATC